MLKYINKVPKLIRWLIHYYYLIFPGVDSIGFDPQRFARDYHIIGFRECAAEVARYLVTIEGMDIQDPLRLRLMSHLQCFVAQRELNAKPSTSGLASPNWSTLQNSYQQNYSGQGYQAYAGTAPITPQHQHANQQHNSFGSSYMSAPSSSTAFLSSTLTSQSPEYSSSGYGTSANSSASVAVNTSTRSNNTSTTTPDPIQSTTGDQQQAESQQPIYTDLSNSNDRLLNLGGSYHYANTNQLYASASNNGYNNNNSNNNNAKPYRPWHPEMAY